MITKVVRRGPAGEELKEFQDLAGKSDELALFVQTAEGARFVTLQAQGRLTDRSGLNLCPLGEDPLGPERKGPAPEISRGRPPWLLRSINDPSRPIAREACHGR